jgi:hypothetical protein
VAELRVSVSDIDQKPAAGDVIVGVGTVFPEQSCG